MTDLTSIKALNCKEVVKYRLNDIKEALKIDKGCTLDRDDLSFKTYGNGYQVSIKDMLKVKTCILSDDILIDILTSLMIEIEGITRHYDYSIGLWIDKDCICIDISEHIKDKSEAIATAIIYQQKAIYSWIDKEVITV